MNKEKDLNPEETKEDIFEEDSDEDFIKSLLAGDENEEDDDEDDLIGDSDEGDGEKDSDKELTEEEQRLKNKNAEEARKRREAEAKEAEEKAAKEAEEKAAKEAEEKASQEKESEADVQSQAANEKKLGAELVAFKKAYPNVDLGELENDKHFKRYIDGKLLGNKDFTGLYEEFVDFKAEMSGQQKSAIQKNYLKSQSSSGSSRSSQATIPSDIFTKEELVKVAEKLPFMHRKDAAKIEEKYYRSIKHYDKN